MHSPSDRTRFLAYLIALSLFFSVAENMLIHPLPFLRYGFAMIPMLYALDKLSFKEYMLLSLGKWLASTLSQGTMLSPFSVIALSSSVICAIVMYILFKVLFSYLIIKIVKKSFTPFILFIIQMLVVYLYFCS